VGQRLFQAEEAACAEQGRVWGEGEDTGEIVGRK